MDSAGKKVRVSQMDRCTGRHCRPVLQLPTGQSRSLQTAGPNTTILAHMEMNRGKRSKMNGAKQNLKQTERGQTVEKGSGHGRQRVNRHTAC